MSGLLFAILFTISCCIATVFGIEPRVFGGEELRFDVHKYLVKLKVYHQNQTPVRCSGSIIDHSWILTAAHCLEENAEMIKVYHRVNDSVRVIAKVYRENFIRHPEYVPGNRNADIALLKTSSAIKFSDDVQPVKLTTRSPREGQSAIIAGYGDSESEDLLPREGTVTVSSCPRRMLPGVICSIDTARAGGGDSGGALISRGRLIGVTSASCRNAHVKTPCLTVYVDVVHKIKWIQEIVNSHTK